MPDLPELPPLDHRRFPVDPHRLDAAVRTGRRRVRRRLLAASPVVAVAVALSLASPGTTTTLRPVPPATQPPTAEPSPSATRTQASPKPKPTSKPTPTPAPLPVATPTLLPPTVPPVPPAEDPAPTPARRWSVTDPDCPGYVPEANYCPNGDHTYFRYDKELTQTARYSYVDGGAPAECSNEGSTYTDDDGTEKTPEEYERRRADAKRWCYGLTGPSSIRSGEGARYAARVCRAADAEAFTLKRQHYDSGRPLWGEPVQWTMLEVLPPGGPTAGDPEQLPASVAAYPPDADSLLVRPGDCLQWSMRWEARTGGPAGRPLPPGEYTMEPEQFWFRNFSTLGTTLPTLTITVAR